MNLGTAKTIARASRFSEIPRSRHRWGSVEAWMPRSWSGQRATALSTLLFVSVATSATSATSSAAAEEEEEAAGGIVYAAPPECPAKRELLAAIDARSTPAHDVDHRTFRVTIERAPGGAWEGRLEVVGASQVPRTARAAECVAVVRTLALFVVIARTPDPSAETTDGTGSAAPPAPARQPEPEKARAQARPAPSVRPARRSHFRSVASVRPSVIVGTSSSPSSASSTPATGVRAQNELAWLPARGLLAPQLRLSLGTASFDTRVSSGTASFRFRTGRLEGCAAVDLGLGLELIPCVGGEIGDLVARTSNLPIAVRASTRWEAASVGAGLRWWILPWISLGIDLVALVPFTRKKFGVVDPARVIYAVPATFFDLGGVVGVGARFD